MRCLDTSTCCSARHLLQPATFAHTHTEPACSRFEQHMRRAAPARSPPISDAFPTPNAISVAITVSVPLRAECCLASVLDTSSASFLAATGSKETPTCSDRGTGRDGCRRRRRRRQLADKLEMSFLFFSPAGPRSSQISMPPPNSVPMAITLRPPLLPDKL